MHFKDQTKMIQNHVTNQNLKKVGDYLINKNKYLGGGQYGQVFECSDTKKPGIKLACKIIVFSENNRKLIEGEKDLLKKAQGDFIVYLYDIINSQANTYIITECCNQGTLSNYLQKNTVTLSESKIINIFHMIAKGYKSLNDKGIFHRDLKPDNILIQNGIPKIADFGFAKTIVNIQEQIQQSLNVGSIIHYLSYQTNIQYKLGTPKYASPQLILSETYSCKTDIFSLGIILYECLYGKTPENPGNKNDLQNFALENKRKGIHDCIKFPQNNRIEVSSDTKDAIRRMLEYNEEKRISISELLDHQIFHPFSIQKPFDNMQQKGQNNENQNIKKNFDQNVQEVQDRGLLLIKMLQEEGKQIEKNQIEDVDSFYIFIRNSSLFFGIVSNQYFDICPSLTQIIPEPYVNYLLMCITAMYHGSLTIGSQMIRSNGKLFGFPHNKDYSISKQYEFTSKNILQEQQSSEMVYTRCKESFKQKLEKYYQDYSSNLQFLQMFKELDSHLNVNLDKFKPFQTLFEKMFKLHFIPAIKQLTNLSPADLPKQSNFFQTIHSLFCIYYKKLRAGNYQTINLEEYYKIFKVDQKTSINQINDILNKNLF